MLQSKTINLYLFIHLFSSSLYWNILPVKINDTFFLRRNRYTAYRQFVRWCWHFLGKEVRVVLPSCVVDSIRKAFPSQDYTGFHQADSDWTVSEDFSQPHLYLVSHNHYTGEAEARLTTEGHPHSCARSHLAQTLFSSGSLHNLKRISNHN